MHFRCNNFTKKTAPPPTHPPGGSALTVDACEKSAVALACGLPRISSAVWGRVDTSTCSPHGFTATCPSLQVRSLLQSQCVARQSTCSFTPSYTQLLGDLCPGLSKFVRVTRSFVADPPIGELTWRP